jgi:hypothetical protein
VSALDDVLRISSDPIAGALLVSDDLPDQLMGMLAKRNGFFAFESALEVFPCIESNVSYSLREWNQDYLWRSTYGSAAPRGLCFGHDIFGVQFVLCDGNVFQFDPETAETSFLAEDLEGWARVILDDYDYLTGHTLAHEWQSVNGPIKYRHRLLPITPFVLGGEYNIDNLVSEEASKAMRIRGEFACVIKDLPDGSMITYKVGS